VLQKIQPALKTVLETGTVCIKIYSTEKVQSALKLYLRTRTVCITNSSTIQVQSALPEVQHSGHILGNDVV